MMNTNPSGFKTPHSLRNKVARLLWSIAYMLMFRPTPYFMWAWRSFLLRCFGAKIDFACLHQSVKIWSPWLLELGSEVYIDKGVNLYNAFGIKIGDRVIISQGAFLCSATHDYSEPTYPLTGGKIFVEDDCWIAAEAFIHPGITIGQGSVIGARSVVTKNTEPWSVIGGNPAQVIKKRKLSSPDDK